MLKENLTWLPNSIMKGVSTPIIVYEPFKNQNYAGFYGHGTKNLTVVETVEELIPSVLAHELCHYLQYTQGRLNHKINWEFDPEDNYEQAIHNYFKAPWEYEALRFEYKYAKNWCNEWWLRKLVHENLNNPVVSMVT